VVARYRESRGGNEPCTYASDTYIPRKSTELFDNLGNGTNDSSGAARPFYRRRTRENDARLACDRGKRRGWQRRRGVPRKRMSDGKPVAFISRPIREDGNDEHGKTSTFRFRRRVRDGRTEATGVLPWTRSTSEMWKKVPASLPPLTKRIRRPHRLNTDVPNPVSCVCVGGEPCDLARSIVRAWKTRGAPATARLCVRGHRQTTDVDIVLRRRVYTNYYYRARSRWNVRTYSSCAHIGERVFPKKKYRFIISVCTAPCPGTRVHAVGESAFTSLILNSRAYFI